LINEVELLRLKVKLLEEAQELEFLELQIKAIPPGF